MIRISESDESLSSISISNVLYLLCVIMSESDLGGLFIRGLLSFLPPLGGLSWGRLKTCLASSFVIFWSDVAAPPGGSDQADPSQGSEFSILLHGFAAGTADVVWHVWVLHAEEGTRIGLSCLFRRPCSDFMDMLRRLISCRIIIIIIY